MQMKNASLEGAMRNVNLSLTISRRERGADAYMLCRWQMAASETFEVLENKISLGSWSAMRGQVYSNEQAGLA
jgi:hypothetical protein